MIFLCHTNDALRIYLTMLHLSRKKMIARGNEGNLKRDERTKKKLREIRVVAALYYSDYYLYYISPTQIHNLSLERQSIIPNVTHS